MAERRLVSEKKILKQRRGSDKSCLRVEATQARSSEIAQKEGWLRAELRQELEKRSEKGWFKEDAPAELAQSRGASEVIQRMAGSEKNSR